LPGLTVVTLPYSVVIGFSRAGSFNAEVTLTVPIGAYEVDVTASPEEALCEFLTSLRAVIQPDDVTAGDIAEGADIPDLD
jgi:hypothetical protein